MKVVNPELKTFSADKLAQQDPKWVDEVAPPATMAKGAPEAHDEDEDEMEGERTPPPSFRPPAIVTETRVPNALDSAAREARDPEFCTVIVVQGDDPEVVANHLAALKRRLEEKNE